MMATSTEQFGVIPVKLGKRMGRIHGNKRRALIFGCPARDSDNSISTSQDTTIPIQTCWVLRQQEHQVLNYYQQRQQQQCNIENHKNVNSRLSFSHDVRANDDDDSRCNDKRRTVVGAPSVRQFPSHVFRESSLIILIIISIFSSYLIRPGNGLHPPQCQWSLYQDIERLNCLVETGNSLIVEEEVHGIGPEHAKSLWVQCSSTFSDTPPNSNSANGGDLSLYSPSSSALATEGMQEQYQHHQSSGFVLSHGVFMAVPNLRDLRLDNCKISEITSGALSYLPYLQNLTVRAHTPSTFSLEIKTGVLQGLPELRHLDLSTTSLSSLPNDFLSFLPSLERLNLSSCWLRDFRFITPQDPTNPKYSNLKVLDISNNLLTLLPPATFAAATKLEELRIEKNSITIAAERALLGLSSLLSISLKNNEISSMPPQFFKDNRQLQEIYLDNNSLSVLAPGLFTGLKHLVVLDLSNNELTSEWVNGETFRGLENLFSLNLANNKLSKIDSDLFQDLRFLQMLNMERNDLSFIDQNAFSGMPNLYTLILSHNKLVTFSCNGLHGLSFLSMDNNKIERVEPDSFNNCSGLQDLNLSGNKLTQVPEALSVLTHLRTVDLGENNITAVGNFGAFPHLYGLRLTNNAISSIERDAFTHLPMLKIVNLSSNNLTSVHPGLFDNNPNLQAIRLDTNKISDISNLFKNIPNLLWLNISANQLEELKYEEFPQRLQWLDLRSNKIHTVGNCMDLDNLRIRNLDLSQNYIKEIGSSNLPDSIENVNFNFNSLTTIHPYTFFRKPNISKILLTHNKISKLNMNSLRLAPDRDRGSVVYLNNNPLECDCSMEWLQHVNNDETSGQYPIIQDVTDVKCTLSFDRLYEPISYLSIQSSQFLCKYESHCFKTCQCCEYDACDCKMTCPKNCSCYHDQAWTTNLVDCSMLEQNFIPGRIPMDVTELYLDGNVFTILDSHSFIGRKNLKALYLNSSGIEIIKNKSFTGLKALKTMHLNNNFIEVLNGYEFEDLENLDTLYLNDNSISYIANETFSSLHRLKKLYLHNNNMLDVAVWQLTTRIGFLQEITLRGNEWSCECHFATQLKNWLIENAKIMDASEVHCVDQVSSLSPSENQIEQTRGGPVTNGQQNRSRTELVVVRLLDQKNHRCTSSSSQSTDLTILEAPKTTKTDEFSFAEYVPWVVCITGVILIIFLISALCYYWRQSLRVWLHSQCGIRLSTSRENENLFDCFISYSSKDDAYIQQLASELERNNPPYRLCLRYRDLPTGGTYLADTIVQASEASKRTILVLSHHFLKGEWSRTDVKSAHHSLLKDRNRKVIIILLGDLPSKDLDPDIRLYLKNHTHLNCDDKKFWEKLRYALPDVKVKTPVFRGIPGRTSRNNSQQTRSATAQLSAPASETPTTQRLQPQPHHHLHQASAAAHYHYNQPSPNMSQAHHLTHLGPPPPPSTAPPFPGLLANLPPNIPNGTIGPHGYHPHHTTLHHGGGGLVTTVIGGSGVGMHSGSTASISTSSNNSGSQRAPQRHQSLVNSAHHPNSRQNAAIQI